MVSLKAPSRTLALCFKRWTLCDKCCPHVDSPTSAPCHPNSASGFRKIFKNVPHKGEKANRISKETVTRHIQCHLPKWSVTQVQSELSVCLFLPFDCASHPPPPHTCTPTPTYVCTHQKLPRGQLGQTRGFQTKGASGPEQPREWHN